MISSRKYLAAELNLFRRDSDRLSLILEKIYYLVVAAVFILIMRIDSLWYLKLIYICFAAVIPLIVADYIIGFMRYRIRKKIPDCMENFQYNLNRKLKIDAAVKDTSDSLSGNIKRPFQILYYNLSRNSISAFDDFKRIFNEKNIDTFSEMLRAYMLYGGDFGKLNKEISDLIIKIREEYIYEDKNREKLMKYRLAAVFMIIMTLLMYKYMNIIVPDMGQVSQSPSQYVLVVMFYIVYFFAIDILQKL